MRQKPGREMLEFCRDRQADVLRFAADTTWPCRFTTVWGRTVTDWSSDWGKL